MDILIEILKHWGLGLLGVSLFVLSSLHKSVLKDWFKPKQFFLKYRLFWIITIALHLVIAILVNVEPGTKELIESLGFAVDQTNMGWVALGFSLAATASTSKKVREGKDEEHGGQ